MRIAFFYKSYGDRRSVGRPKKTWSKVVEEDMRKLDITEDITHSLTLSFGITEFAGVTLHGFCFAPPQGAIFCVLHSQARELEVIPQDLRSEERRVGKECRSRWSPYH